MSTFVRDVMTPHAIWVAEDTPFNAIAVALRRHRVSAFPVLNKDARVVGVVSESDLLPKEALGGGDDRIPGMIAGILHRRQLEKARGITARDLMSSPAITVGEADTVEHAARILYLRGIKRLPVLDADGHLAGIVSRTDVLSVYDRPDADIYEEIVTDVLEGEEHVRPGGFDVGVKAGVVTVSGRPLTSVQGNEIVRRIRHVEGVVTVRDRFRYPETGPAPFDVAAGFPVD